MIANEMFGRLQPDILSDRGTSGEECHDLKKVFFFTSATHYAKKRTGRECRILRAFGQKHRLPDAH